MTFDACDSMLQGTVTMSAEGNMWLRGKKQKVMPEKSESGMKHLHLHFARLLAAGAIIRHINSQIHLEREASVRQNLSIALVWIMRTRRRLVYYVKTFWKYDSHKIAPLFLRFSWQFVQQRKWTLTKNMDKGLRSLKADCSPTMRGGWCAALKLRKKRRAEKTRLNEGCPRQNGAKREQMGTTYS